MKDIMMAIVIMSPIGIAMAVVGWIVLSHPFNHNVNVLPIGQPGQVLCIGPNQDYLWVSVAECSQYTNPEAKP